MRGAIALLTLAVFAAAAPPASGAEFGIAPGGFAVALTDPDGDPESRAGAHPDRLRIDFALTVEETETSLRDLVFDLPPGFGGNPNAVPPCPRALFEAGEECPEESQVGTITFGFTGGGESTLPIFQLEREADELFAFGSTPAFDVPLATELRPDDFGITFAANDLPESSLSEGRLELWGVPADHQTGTSIPRRPLLTTPTRCGPLVFGLHVRSWQPGADWLSASAEADPPLQGCGDLAFEPQLGLELTSPAADSPTGARIDVTMSETEDPDGLANAQLGEATIEMPEELTVSPGGAAGLIACSDSQLGLGDTNPASCPASSKVGRAEFDSALLEEPMTGTVYLGEERGAERFRLFVVVPGPGILLKFVAALHADPATGRLSASLRDLPPVPLSRLTLSIDGGPRALLAAPLRCGPFQATGSFEPVGGGVSVGSSAAGSVAEADGSPCLGAPPFAPTLATSGSNRGAGRPTGLSMVLRRRGGEQLPRRFTVKLPAGLSAALGAVDPCPTGTTSCPEGSRIGRASAEVGSGSSPAALHGDVYVTDSYRGAPFGLLMTFRAVIGPFDLGTVAARASVRLDSRTGRVSVATDALPQTVEGIQIRFQAIGLDMDRQGFLRNPTSCSARSTEATIEAGGGAIATARSPFEPTRCDRLGLRPRFKVALLGRSVLRRGGKPELRISARFRRGDTNLRAMELALPRAIRLSISGLREICSRRDASDGRCSEASRVGTAFARTSLLKRRLKGSISVVEPAGDGLPDLWLSLEASGVRVAVRGQTTMRDGRVVTKLVGLPDIPLSAFSMHMRGGGAFSLRSGLCREGRGRRLVAPLTARGQNGTLRRLRLRVRAKARCA